MCGAAKSTTYFKELSPSVFFPRYCTTLPFFPELLMDQLQAQKELQLQIGKDDEHESTWYDMLVLSSHEVRMDPNVPVYLQAKHPQNICGLLQVL